MKRIKIYIYIILIIVIFANILQVSTLTRKLDPKTEKVEQSLSSVKLHFFWQELENCSQRAIYKQGFSFSLPNCDQFQTGDYLEVIGSHHHQSANGFFEQKRLSVQAVKLLELEPSSVKFWWLRGQQFWWRQAAKIKTQLLEGIESLLPGPHFALVKGMVFGGSDELSPEVGEAFRMTGLTHVVSASGYNLSVVAGVGLSLLAVFLPRRAVGWGTIALIWFYALLAELTPPIKRAAIMLTLNLLAKRVFFRQYSLTFSLALSAAILLLWQPALIHNLSFCLSMLATSGIILILPRLTAWRGKIFQRSVGVVEKSSRDQTFLQSAWLELKESFLVTVAAQTLTLPLVAVVFGEISLLSFIVNPLLLWLTPLVTLSGLSLMLVAQLSVWLNLRELSLVLSSLVWLPSELFLSGVKFFGQFKGGLVRIK